MSDACTVRQFQPGDEEKILSLLSSVFKGWPHFDLPCSPLDHWMWKFQSSGPSGDKIFVAESDGGMIGCSHSLFTNVKIGDKIMKCRQAVDVAVHPDFRSQGVYSSMNSVKNNLDQQANIGMVYSATNSPILTGWNRRVGRKGFPRTVSVMVRMHDVDSFIEESQIEDETRRRLAGYAVRSAKLLNKVEKAVLKPAKEDSSIVVSVLDRFDERANHLWDKVKDDYSFITERTTEYLNWRYRDPRGGVYTVLQAVKDGELLGYIVVRISSWRNRREGMILDVLTLPGRVDCLGALVREGLRFFDESGVNEIYYLGVLGNPYTKYLRKFGFLNTKTGISVTVNKKMADEEDFSKFHAASPERLLFQYGDLDWI